MELLVPAFVPDCYLDSNFVFHFQFRVKADAALQFSLYPARERLDEKATGKSKGDHRRDHVKHRERAQETVVNLLDARKARNSPSGNI